MYLLKTHVMHFNRSANACTVIQQRCIVFYSKYNHSWQQAVIFNSKVSETDNVCQFVFVDFVFIVCWCYHCTFCKKKNNDSNPDPLLVRWPHYRGISSKPVVYSLAVFTKRNLHDNNMYFCYEHYCKMCFWSQNFYVN